MELYEFQGKALFRKFGIHVPVGTVHEKAEDIYTSHHVIGSKVVVKAQVHAGGRGKAGGVRVVGSMAEACSAAAEILSMTINGLLVRKVLVEEALQITREYYLAIALDRDNGCDTLMLSAEGGMDIEDIAAERPELLVKLDIHPHLGIQEFQIRELIHSFPMEPPHRDALASVIRKLCRMYTETDATMAEINPLALCRDTFVAADAKVTVDENSLARHPELREIQEMNEDDPLEREAHLRGLAYVRLDGDIGIIGNGAGLVMATLDIISQEGGRPANFLDIGGGAKAEVVRKSLEVVLRDPNVKGIFVNVFGGITRCDEVARGIIDAIESLDVRIPLVVKICGTLEEEGREILRAVGITPVSEIVEGARKIIGLVGR
jgi:succinyl-CoA synthetase beta subunit